MRRDRIQIKVQSKNGENLPQYSTIEAAGADLRAQIDHNIVLQPGQRALISTGLRMEIPPGYELQIRPRSGLALKHGITVLNTPGTIDSDYRGDVGVILINHGSEPFTVEPGMRIAQAVIAAVVQVDYVQVQQPLQESVRSGGGFGHTGVY